MMMRVLVPLLFPVLLMKAFASPSSSGVDPASPCPPRWLLFGQRCFAFYPVWSTWSTATSLCSETYSDLVSLHTPEEHQFVRQLTNTSVWLGGYQAQQNDSWFWSDGSPVRIKSWTNETQGKTREGGACMEMEPKGGRLHSAPCGELRFYICCIRANSRSAVIPSSSKPGIVPGVSLFDVVWSFSNLLAEEILYSSPFLGELQSGILTKSCYISFVQQEALYLQRVSNTLEALISSQQEMDDTTPLLLDALEHYSSKKQSLLTSRPPQWLLYSLQSFHSVVLKEPVYWLVALSARTSLHMFLANTLSFHKPKFDPMLVSNSMFRTLYHDWKDDITWTQRYQKVIEERQNQINVYQAIQIFREHMMNQKNFFKAVTCDTEDES
uniref:C-type lectin domain-containing protein n=1 Tax=Monopterus albus TaxID=43700 RepID=A0A3Q3Q7A5_MONAL|nr:uncharacterized protein LOC109951912 isoform X2 [Monopterus albus]